MRMVFKSCCLLAVFVWAVSFVGCAADDQGSDQNNSDAPQYFVHFQVGDQSRNWNEGVSGLHGEIPIGYVAEAPDPPRTTVYGLSYTWDGSSTLSNYLLISIPTNAVGTFSDTSTDITYDENGTKFNSVSWTVELISIGVEGENVRGAFSAVVSNNGAGLKTITNGTFTVIRCSKSEFPK